MRILRLERDRPLKDDDRGLRLPEPYQAGGFGVQRVELRRDERIRLVKMLDRGSAIAFSVLQHREHRVRRRIVRTQTQDSIEQWHGGSAARFVLRLRGAFESREIVGVDLQRALKGLEPLGPLADARERHAVERPELRIVRRLLERRSTALDRLRKVPRAQGRGDCVDSRALLSKRGLARRRQQDDRESQAYHGCRGELSLKRPHG